ncbi:MAG: translation initiation factor IF-2 [Rhodothermia bacterium]|nr:MAG: translation initiation factor IF-2 [Rhodothermia bacterium]
MSTTDNFKKVRLFRVSRELNIAVDSLVEHLTEAGFADALSGKGINASITNEDAYQALVEEFAEDKAMAARVNKKRAARVVTESGEIIDAEPPEREAAADEPEKAEAATPVEEEVPISDADIDIVAEPEEKETEEIDEADVQDIDEAPGEPESSEPDVSELEISEPEPAESEASEPTAEQTKAADEPPATADGKPEEIVESSAAESAETKESSVPDAPEFAQEDVKELLEGEDPESLLAADRYKLAGTKILGKIDLEKVKEEDRPPAGKRSRKRKRKRISGGEKSNKGGIAQPDGKASKKKGKKKKGPKVDEADVEQTLQETLRELEMGASRVRQRRRRQKREDHAAERQREMEEKEEGAMILKLTEYVSTGELANLMDVPVTELISVLFEAGMMVSINQRLDADTISFVADEYGYEVEFITEFTTSDVIIEEDAPEDLEPRSAVVTVMGHVDHGKTSLLDHIRSENVVAGEAGGITQHIGAYHVKLKNDKELTFLDTPGHEAFTAMRARGAQVTDLVILVVAADDAVMPQTVEAINHARAAEVPIVVAINKIDKPDANDQRVMQQLADENVLVEQFGGKVQCELVSAKTGTGIDELLDRVLLESELLDLKANPNRNTVGTVIESKLEKGRGVVASVLVQNGTLKVGDAFIAGIYAGRVRAMFDERDHRIDQVGPAMPAQVIGLDGSPEVGDSFIVFDDEKEVKEISQKRQQISREQAHRQRKHITLDEIGRRLALGDFRELHLVVKGDVGGSVEALSDSLLKLSTEEVVVNIIHKGVGAINESDVMLATASNAIIVGFQVRPVLGARQLAEREEIDIRLYSVIYHAISEVRDALEGLLSPEKHENILGMADVRETFKVPKIGMIAGCFVVDGRIKRSDKVRLIRDAVVIYDGALASLRRFKDDVREVQNGYECGIGIENFNDIKVGDQIEAYEIVETKRTLDV